MKYRWTLGVFFASGLKCRFNIIDILFDCVGLSKYIESLWIKEHCSLIGQPG